MPHCITDKFLLIVVIIGYGGPTMAGTVTAKAPFHTGQCTQTLQSCIEASQRTLLLTVSIGVCAVDKGEQIG